MCVALLSKTITCGATPYTLFSIVLYVLFIDIYITKFDNSHNPASANT